MSSDDVPVNKRPPKAVLDSLKQVYKSNIFLKAASNTLPAKKMATPAKQIAPPTKKMATPTKQVAPPTKKVPLPTKNVAPPAKKMATPITHQEGFGKKKAQSKQSKALLRKSPSPLQADIPVPPPPPPPPLFSKPRPHPAYPRSNSVGTHRRVLLEQVRTSGRKVASKLRPVVTIEKRAFRVGE